MQITEIYRPQANVSFGSQWRGGIGWVAPNVPRTGAVWDWRPGIIQPTIKIQRNGNNHLS